MKTAIDEADHLLEAPPEYTAVDYGDAAPYGPYDVRVWRSTAWHNQPDKTTIFVQRRGNVDGLKPIGRTREIKGRILQNDDPEVLNIIDELKAKVDAVIAKSNPTPLDRTPTFIAPFQLIDKVRSIVEPYDYVRCVTGNTQSTENSNSEAIAGLTRRLQPGQKIHRILTSHGKPEDYMDRACIYFNATPEEAEVVRYQLERLGRTRAKAKMGVKSE